MDKLIKVQHILWLHKFFHCNKWKTAWEALDIISLSWYYNAEETTRHLWLPEKNLNGKIVLDIWWWVSPMAADIMASFPRANYVSVDPNYIPTRAHKENTILWGANLALEIIEWTNKSADIEYLKTHLRRFFSVKDKLFLVWWVWWSLPIASNSSELVILSYLLDNIISRIDDFELVEKILKEAHRCVTSTGELVIMWPIWWYTHVAAMNPQLKFLAFTNNFSIRLKKWEVNWYLELLKKVSQEEQKKKQAILKKAQWSVAERVQWIMNLLEI